MTIKSKLTRKAGPLPVWGWAALAIGAWFLIFRGPLGSAHAATGGTQLPYTPTSGSGAQQPSSGQGNPADNTNGDLLAALQDNKSAYDALLAALQYGGGFGGYGGYGAGYSAGGSGGAVGGVPAGFDSGTNNAPVASYADYSTSTVPTADPAVIAAAGDQPVTGYLAPSADAGYIIDPTTGQVYTGASSIEGGLRQRVGQPYQADALSRYLVNSVGYDPAITATPTVGGPTVTQVQAAPVDTTGVLNAQTADVSTQATTPRTRATITKPTAV